MQQVTKKRNRAWNQRQKELLLKGRTVRAETETSLFESPTSDGETHGWQQSTIINNQSEITTLTLSQSTLSQPQPGNLQVVTHNATGQQSSTQNHRNTKMDFDSHQMRLSSSQLSAWTGVSTSSSSPGSCIKYDLCPQELEACIAKKHKTERTVVMLVGLPASGKSTILRQLARHLHRRGYKCDIFNAGDVRRRMSARMSTSDFFDPTNVDARRQRDHYASTAMAELLTAIADGVINVGFLDATNTSVLRRRAMYEMSKEAGVVDHFIVLDVSCDIDEYLVFNIHGKAFNADYRYIDHDSAIADFKRRTEHYYRAFEPLTRQEIDAFDPKIAAWVQIKNCGRSASVYRPGSCGDEIIELVTDFVYSYGANEGQRYVEAVEAFAGGKYAPIESALQQAAGQHSECN